MRLPLLVADLGQALATDLPLSTTLLLLCREATLQEANLHLTNSESLLTEEPERHRRQIALALDLVPHELLLTVGMESPWIAPPSFHCRRLTFDFPIPAFAHRLRLWEELLEQTGCKRSSDVNITELASKFVLTGGEILAACREARDRAALRGAAANGVSMMDLEAAARSQSNQALRRLAQKVNPVCDWNDLVLPPRTMQQLREVCATEKYRHVVYHEWGFDRRLALGKGLNVLFCGPSGTGKTMAASILAKQLGLDLYKIDLSTVVSKYIGETEKQLSQIFREAQSSNAMLFFDEADALFGKRSEVKDAHDRYANVEVAYLLQKMEEYEGIVILATNFRKNMDDAFTRRMHHIVEFPFPDAEYRELIWRRLMPPDSPVAQDVDFGFLSRQFELSGGHICNVAVAAAFLAAGSGSPIRMEHFILATARELQKLGRLASRADFREYYELTRLRG
jgi:SpoVK/Ycf46/Vps4 family AAA+-type ATPase